MDRVRLHGADVLRGLPQGVGELAWGISEIVTVIDTHSRLIWVSYSQPHVLRGVVRWPLKCSVRS